MRWPGGAKKGDLIMAGLFSVEDVLDPQFLSEAYREFASATQANPLLSTYSSPKPYKGNVIEMAYFPAEKEPAPLNKKNSPARTLSLRGAKTLYHKPIHIFNECTIALGSVANLRQPDNQMIDQKGVQEITRQFEMFGSRQILTEGVALAKALTSGVIYVNPEGVILESSSGAEMTIDLQVPSGHNAKQNYDGYGDILNLPWDNASAPILTHLRKIRVAAEEQNAEQPRHVWMQSIGLDWLRANTEIKAYIQGGGSPERTEYLLNNYANVAATQPGGTTMELGGYTFHFYDGTYTAADGTTKKFIPADAAIITPEMGGWFGHYETDELVPTEIGVFQSVSDALASCTEMYGTFAYATINHNPMRLSMFLGTNFLRFFRNPNAVWMPTVDF